MAINNRRIENGGLIAFLILVTVGLGAIVSGFAGALLWAGLAALLFQPLYQRLLARLPGSPNIAAAVTLAIITVAVVIPAITLISLIVDQATGVYQQMQTGRVDIAVYFVQIHDALPLRVQRMLDSAGLDTLARVQARLSSLLGGSVSVIAGSALSIGRNAAAFALSFGVGLYATYFLLRDGFRIAQAVEVGLPLERSVAQRLLEKLAAVVRATIKGSGVVALVQGTLGAATFWIIGLPAALLWGMMMAIAALLPAIGPAIIWAPVAIYLLATGAIWQAVVVLVSGVAVIGLADNLLRPILVGRDTGIPDWLVLVTTLGGIDLLGLGGIVVGPLVAALFLTGWQILTEQRNPAAGPPEPAA